MKKQPPSYKPETCPVSRFVAILGDDWSWLIIREAFRGASKFSDFQKSTGIAKNILTDRMKKLTEHGIFERRDVGATGPRFEYFLSEKGKSLEPLLRNIIGWSRENLNH
ncbi:transcriptional regulator [Alteromonadaceae bacterium M269]|nr:transcriptional regulator [Alteromonadaceae bacterium M269]